MIKLHTVPELICSQNSDNRQFLLDSQMVAPADKLLTALLYGSESPKQKHQPPAGQEANYCVVNYYIYYILLLPTIEVATVAVHLHSYRFIKNNSKNSIHKQ